MANNLKVKGEPQKPPKYVKFDKRQYGILQRLLIHRTNPDKLKHEYVTKRAKQLLDGAIPYPNKHTTIEVDDAVPTSHREMINGDERIYNALAYLEEIVLITDIVKGRF